MQFTTLGRPLPLCAPSFRARAQSDRRDRLCAEWRRQTGGKLVLRGRGGKNWNRCTGFRNFLSLSLSKPPRSFSRFGHVTLCQIKQLEESVVIVDSVEHVIVLNYGENCDFNDSWFLFVWPRFLILGNNGSKSVSYDPLVWSVEIIKRVVHANRVHFCEI